MQTAEIYLPNLKSAAEKCDPDNRRRNWEHFVKAQSTFLQKAAGADSHIAVRRCERLNWDSRIVLKKMDVL